MYLVYFFSLLYFCSCMAHYPLVSQTKLKGAKGDLCDKLCGTQVGWYKHGPRYLLGN